jgi:membrane fusion protein, multidrug efflux system
MQFSYKRLGGWLAVVLILGLLALPKLPFTKESGVAATIGQPVDTRLNVSAVVVQPTSLRDRIVTTGSVRAGEEIEVRNEVAGLVTGIHFAEGRPVREGALLVKINDQELQAQLQRARYRVRLAEGREERQKMLLDKGGISLEEYESTLNELNVLRAEVSLIEAQIRRTEVRAPFDGVIGLRDVSVGSYLSAGTRIATLQNINPVKIDFSIPERYSARVRTGDQIVFTVEGMPGSFRGQVYAFEPRIEAGTRTLLVRARSPNPGGRLLPGAFASIDLVFDEVEDALTVPAVAVVPELGGAKVFVYEGGRVVARDILTGLRTAASVQVLSGISAQDTVVTTGVQQLRSGMPVRLTITSDPN